MSRITAEMTLEQMEDFFTIGKTPKVESVARSISGGRALDPVTGKPAVYVNKPFIPAYKRRGTEQKAYAEKYREEEDRLADDMSQLHFGSSRASTVSGHMEQLEADSTITGLSTVILPEGQTEEEANLVYQNYNFRHEYDKSLSITAYRQEVVDNIESNQAIVVQGPTGSGKTTQVPQYILDHYAAQGKYCNIVVTQPRKIAAMSICRRVCHERDWAERGICGYQVSMDRHASPDTRLLYCTTGVLLEKLISAGHMQQFTHVILDEVHERDQDTDFCLLIVKHFLRTNSRDVKVVLMSATAESEKFADYFGLPVRGYKQPAPILPIEGRTYKISEYFLEDLKPLGELPIIDEDKPGIASEAIDLTVKLVLQFDTIESQQTGYSNTAVPRGAVLIFLPGLGEITDVDERLRPHSERNKWWIIPLHSSITNEEQAAVFRKPALGSRKIILSTNIAESSITVPDIKYVLDFCLTKNLVSDPDTSFTSLQTQWAAKSNCIQRMGRAGRVSDGRVYKMVTRKFYKEVNPRHAIPEMERAPLEILVLKSKRLNMGEPKAILGRALDPPRLDNIEITVLLLKEIGALVSLDHRPNPYDGKLTFLGRVLSQLPVDIRLGKLMMLGHVFGILEETIIVAACLSMKSFFARPYKSYLHAYKKKLEWAENSFSDCVAYLNAFKTWRHQKETRYFNNNRQEYQWGREAFIQIKRIGEVHDMVLELTERLRQFNIVTPRVPRGRNDKSKLTEEEHQLLLKLVFCGAFYPYYFSQGQMNEEDRNRAMSGVNPCTTVMLKGLPQNQGALYRKQLEAMFSYCESVPGSRPNISFEETKAFVEFPRAPSDKSTILQAVYVAIKMRQLRIPLIVRLHETEVASKKLQQLSEIQDEKAKTMARLRTNRIKAFNDAAMSMSEGPKQVELPSPIQTIVPIYVTEIVNCGHFWGHYADPDTWTQICELQDNINKFRGQNLKPVLQKDVQPGSFCLAPFTDRDTSYYRARILGIKPQPNDVIKATIFFVDYGNTDDCLLSDLRELSRDFLTLKFQAIECELVGIKPSPIKCPNGRWTEKAKERFAQLVSGKGNLLAKVYSIVHGVLRVELIGKKPVGEQDDNINTRLVNEYFADRRDESFLSKQSHEDRETAALMLPNNTTDAKQSFDQHDRSDAASSNWLKSNSRPLGTPSGDWMELPNQDDLVALPKSGGFGRSVNLQGPDSMYEMKFYSMTAIGCLREARIDRDSVNSVAINDTIHDKHQRLMVAAHVGLNPTKTMVMARDTTIMPLIPGLPGLVGLLFCPETEMRCDPAKTRYTGALCGLGYCDITEGPVMPDHDLEITFDTSFDEEDLKMINGVRMGIFIAIGTETAAVDWGHDALYRIQKSTQKKILDLIQRRRDTLEPYYFPRQHQWRVVDPDDLLYPQLDDLVSQKSQGLSLHCGIALNTGSDDESEMDEEENIKMQEYLKHWRSQERHVQMLHSRASRSTVRSEVRCELCNLTLITPRELMMHLALRSHIQKENTVRENLGLQE